MARPADPNAPYRVKTHVTKGYTYASTQPCTIDPKTGKKTYRHIHWGTVDDDLRFCPGTRFFLAAPEERARLIFPEDWDLSEAERLTGIKDAGRPAYTGECKNRLYGDIWLLEQIALKTGIRQDLENVFGGNREIVDDIMTLAMFPYLTHYTYNRLARWQEVAKAPSQRSLSFKEITLLTQSITEQNRMDLLALRAKRLGKDELCAVDSTSRSAYGTSLTDIHWGKNKDKLPLPQTIEVVVYTLTGHMPVYYRTFPGNMPDSRSLDVIFADLDHAGFKDLVFITDRGYDTLKNLERSILRGQPMVMFVKTGQRECARVIAELGEFGALPDGMTVDADVKVYWKQYDIDYTVEGTGSSLRISDRLRLNLYFDPVRRGLELMELDSALSFQEEALIELQAAGTALEGDTCKREFNYYIFVSLILSSYVRHIWKSTRLAKLFTSSLDVLDEMRPIRMIEHTNRAKVITPFIGKQVDISEEFGFEIPKGSAPAYVSRQKPERKRGCPPKRVVERDY
jgi:hypothetical protein